MKPIYVSIDIETDGPIPGTYSMLSLGAVAFDETGKEIESFWGNMWALDGATQDPDTMKWWATQPEAWKAATDDPHNPKHVMEEFVWWAESLPGKPIAVAYPAGFDWTFVYWYLMNFARRSPFGFQCLDLKSYAAAVLGVPFREVSKRKMPKEWFAGLGQHNHVAVDDAREQGKLFFAMKDWKKS